MSPDIRDEGYNRNSQGTGKPIERVDRRDMSPAFHS